MNKEVDIADLIAGELLCSRADAYDLMRNALSKVEQEPVTDEENEQFSEDVSNFKGADPEATKFALEQFLKRREMHPATIPQSMKQSLTDEQILASNYPDGEENGPIIAAPDFEIIAFARAIETALNNKAREDLKGLTV